MRWVEVVDEECVWGSDACGHEEDDDCVDWRRCQGLEGYGLDGGVGEAGMALGLRFGVLGIGVGGWGWICCLLGLMWWLVLRMLVCVWFKGLVWIDFGLAVFGFVCGNTYQKHIIGLCIAVRASTKGLVEMLYQHLGV